MAFLAIRVLILGVGSREEALAEIVRIQTQRRNLSPLAWSYFRGRRYLRLKSQRKRSDKTSMAS